MTIAQQIGDLHLARELDGKRREFAMVAKYLLLGKGAFVAADLARGDGAPQRVVDAIKASVDPMSLSSVGAQLSPFALLASSFMQSLAIGGSAFDIMLGSMMRLPLRTRIVAVSQ